MINNVAVKPLRVIVETTNDSYCLDAYVIYEDDNKTLALRIDRVAERVLFEEITRSVEQTPNTSMIVYVIYHSAAHFGTDFEVMNSTTVSPDSFRYRNRGMRLECMLLKSGLKSRYENGIILFEDWGTPEERAYAETLLKLQHGTV